MFAHTTFGRDVAWIDNDKDDEREAIVTDVSAWPLIQAGIHDAHNGLRSHRIRRVFHSEGSSAAQLRLVFFVDRGPCPDLRIELDGIHRGIIHPTVFREDRTRTGEPGPIAGEAVVEVRLPAEWLGEGDHELSISTVFDEGSAIGAPQMLRSRPVERLPPARSTYGTWFGNYIRWSHASLTATIDDGSRELKVCARTTPFYVDDDGAEMTLIETLLTIPAGGVAPRDLTLVVDETSEPLAFPGDLGDFGQVRWRSAVPSFDDDARVRVLVDDAVAFDATLSAARRWTLHLIPHVHLDLGFTDSQGKVLELHCRNIDRALDLFDIDPSFRFCVDGAVIAREFERTRSARQVERMKAAIRAGRLGVNAFHSNMLTGLTTLGEMIHSTDYAREYLPISQVTHHRYANITDVPVYASTVPSALAEVGITRFVGMSNHHRGGTDTSDVPHLLSPMHWEGPDGRRVLAHFADHYSQLRFLAADPQSVAGATDAIQRFTERYERDEYAPHDLAVIGTHADNEDLADGDHQFAARWNEVFSFPRFQLSTFDEYLDSVTSVAERLPVWRSESGGFWEDGAGSAAGIYGTYRRAQAQLPAVETLGAALSLRDPRYRTNRHELDRAWDDLAVAAEHTLTWARATTHPHAEPTDDQLAWKRRYIDDADRITIDEQRRQLSRLAESENLSGPGLIVYNPHAWTADLQIEFDLAVGVQLFDADGTVDYEVLEDCAGIQRCRAALRGVPAHSFRFLPASGELHTVPGGEAPDDGPSEPTIATMTPTVTPTDDARESSRGDGWEYTLASETGLLESLRWQGRELLAPAQYPLGQLVRTAARGAAGVEISRASLPARHDHVRHRIDSIDNRYSMADVSAIDVQMPAMSLAKTEYVYDGMRLTWTSDDATLRGITLSILLGVDGRAQLDVNFVKGAVLDMEAIYLSFPFAASNPVVRYDRPLGWVAPARDHGKGASNEWATLTSVLTVTDGDEGAGVAWTSRDSALFTIGDVVRGAMPSDFPGATGQVYGYLMNNFWPCNTPPTQEGPVSFRFTFTAIDRFDGSAAKRFGAQERVSAPAAHILPLDRFAPDESPVYREGPVLALGNDARVDVHVEEQAEGIFLLTATNLETTARDARVIFPSGDATDLRLPASGFVRVRFGAKDEL